MGVCGENSSMTVLVTGGSGLVGRAVQECIASAPPTDETWVFTHSNEADLTDLEATRALFARHKPTHVLHLAAMVGGLYRNLAQPVDFFMANARMNENVLQVAHEYDVVKVVSCLSTCIFPDATPYPIDETMLHNGPPHASNLGYAMAKRNIDTLNQCYARQFGRCFTSVIPTNVYGPHDNFHLDDSHVIPGLLHKCYLAKKEQTPFVVSGTGAPLRQFIYSADLATLLVWVVRHYTETSPLILAGDPNDEVSIQRVAEGIAAALQFTGDLVFDTTKGDGQYRKTASNAKLRSLSPELGAYRFTTLEAGLQTTAAWFLDNLTTCRR
ncbi:GDP-L-fucose synthase [Saprolegnia diclina VS20]|uniref:GDP-L-fucose synthase n=1 Tax=Saprolegnia diclina (strain VS20) TaxID=1156394 RepID=T0R5C8_SAPDV|nr:GDP-L-fucose synthase [Saprolegnia diclina VS20]EQC41580.1 GDP-L-fucose synthase [Saprolegnia diclina VS20]|eukprot:XP_008605294.1 GDP-L-fucose synthase [Saprolegnia diclina VS20]